MLDTAQGWSVKVERGPDWLFVRLSSAPDHLGDYSHLAEQLWSILSQHFIYRLVLEMDVKDFPSSLIGQLVMLHKRLCSHEGVIRLCGLTAGQWRALESCRLEARFPHYENRDEAVHGHRPTQPR
jgi:hypothetical protein